MTGWERQLVCDWCMVLLNDLFGDFANVVEELVRGGYLIGFVCGCQGVDCDDYLASANPRLELQMTIFAYPTHG